MRIYHAGELKSSGAGERRGELGVNLRTRILRVTVSKVILY